MLRRALLACLLVLVALVAPAAPAQAAPGLTATFSAANNGSWFLDKFVVANPTTASITGWTLEFDPPSGVAMGNFYNGVATQTGSHVRATNAHYNGTVAAGATTEPYSPWFIAYGGGAVPLNCRINGNKCDGSADRVPNAPGGLAVSCIDIYLKGNLPAYNGAGGPGSAAGIFDGIDLDWEWPGAEGHPGNIVRPQDKANNTLLMAEFRRQLDELTTTSGKRYLLTAFTPADPAKIAAGWDIGANGVFRYMDFANVQGYDFHGAGSDNSWEPNRTGHQANLNRDTQDPYAFEFSVTKAIQTYLDAGVNPRRLTIGFPFYGRGWQGVTAALELSLGDSAVLADRRVNSLAAGTANGEWQPATGAAPGQFQEEAGTRGYSNLIAMVPNCTVFHNAQSASTYCFAGNGGQW